MGPAYLDREEDVLVAWATGGTSGPDFPQRGQEYVPAWAFLSCSVNIMPHLQLPL